MGTDEWSEAQELGNLPNVVSGIIIIYAAFKFFYGACLKLIHRERIPVIDDVNGEEVASVIVLGIWKYESRCCIAATRGSLRKLEKVSHIQASESVDDLVHKN